MRITEAQGESPISRRKPYQYSDGPTRKFSREVVVQHYRLYTSDSFELGAASSLHPDLTHAEKFKPGNYWRRVEELQTAYVSPDTLEAMVRKRGQTIFMVCQ